MLLRFLMGDRQAILGLAGDRRLPWLGAVFVGAAAVARCYDREDLTHEPWHLLIPFAVSLVTALLLLGAVLSIGSRHWLAVRPGRPHTLAFIGLFWCTAPLAWAYGIPWEHLLDDQATAVSANLWTLKVVSVWRVLLIARVIQVLFGTPWWSSGLTVLAIADVVLLISLSVMPVPVFAIMGGVMQDAAVRRLAEAAFIWHALSMLALLPLLIALLVIARVRQAGWSAQALPPMRQRLRHPLIAALMVTAVCAAFLPTFQPAQRHRRAVDLADAARDQEEVVRLASALGRDAFPPDWHLPRAQSTADMIARLRAVTAPRILEWVVEECLSAGFLHRAPSEVVAAIFINHSAQIPRWRNHLPRIMTDLDEAQRKDLQTAIDQAPRD